MGGRRNQVAHLSFLDVTMDVENFSKNITHLTCITASTGRGDVDDIEKDITVSYTHLTLPTKLEV